MKPQEYNHVIHRQYHKKEQLWMQLLLDAYYAGAARSLKIMSSNEAKTETKPSAEWK